MQENYRIICTFVLQMIQDELVNRLRLCLGHVPTAEQERAMRKKRSSSLMVPYFRMVAANGQSTTPVKSIKFSPVLFGFSKSLLYLCTENN